MSPRHALVVSVASTVLTTQVLCAYFRPMCSLHLRLRIHHIDEESRVLGSGIRSFERIHGPGRSRCAARLNIPDIARDNRFGKRLNL